MRSSSLSVWWSRHSVAQMGLTQSGVISSISLLDLTRIPQSHLTTATCSNTTNPSGAFCKLHRHPRAHIAGSRGASCPLGCCRAEEPGSVWLKSSCGRAQHGPCRACAMAMAAVLKRSSRVSIARLVLDTWRFALAVAWQQLMAGQHRWMGLAAAGAWAAAMQGCAASTGLACGRCTRLQRTASWVAELRGPAL